MPSAGSSSLRCGSGFHFQLCPASLPGFERPRSDVARWPAGAASFEAQSPLPANNHAPYYFLHISSQAPSPDLNACVVNGANLAKIPKWRPKIGRVVVRSLAGTLCQYSPPDSHVVSVRWSERGRSWEATLTSAHGAASYPAATFLAAIDHWYFVG